MSAVTKKKVIICHTPVTCLYNNLPHKPDPLFVKKYSFIRFLIPQKRNIITSEYKNLHNKFRNFICFTVAQMDSKYTSSKDRVGPIKWDR